jgi:hypothetical protein
MSEPNLQTGAIPTDTLGRGLAFSHAHSDYWVILVGGGYGSFLFRGTEADAEERRVAKSRWEGAVAKKRPASYLDITDAPSTCWNHRGFLNRALYYCECGECSNVVS